MDKQTIKQIQQLLKALGNSPGDIDGIWGKNSQAALMATLKEYDISFATLVETTLPNLQPVSSGIPTWWVKVRHFGRGEMRCQCGGKYCNGFESEPQEKLMLIADEIRDEAHAAAHITSGIRCKRHNAETKDAVPNSKHITGEAMDFYIDGMTSSTLLATVRSKPGIAYAYAVDDRVVHMNI